MSSRNVEARFEEAHHLIARHEFARVEDLPEIEFALSKRHRFRVRLHEVVALRLVEEREKRLTAFGREVRLETMEFDGNLLEVFSHEPRHCGVAVFHIVFRDAHLVAQAVGEVLHRGVRAVVEVAGVAVGFGTLVERHAVVVAAGDRNFFEEVDGRVAAVRELLGVGDEERVDRVGEKGDRAGAFDGNRFLEERADRFDVAPGNAFVFFDRLFLFLREEVRLDDDDE